MIDWQPFTAFEALSLVVAIVGFGLLAWEIRSSAHQNQASVFVAFAERYEAIVEVAGANGVGAKIVEQARLGELPEEDVKAYHLFLNRYVDLIHQEFEIARTGMIDKRIWATWKSYFRAHALSPHFAAWWARNRNTYDPNPRFQTFIRETMNGG